MTLLLLLFAIDLGSLKCNPGVEPVREVIPGRVQIIHIRDWHLVFKDAFASDTELGGVQLEKAYNEHIKTVSSLQASQRQILAGVKEVYIEGLTKSDMPVFNTIIRLMRKTPEEDRLMHLGSAAQLLVEKKITVLPAENEFFEKANPLKQGKLHIDLKEQEAREDAIVRNLSNGGVLILGGAHDLSNNIRRLKLDVGYTVVTPKGYPKL